MGWVCGEGEVCYGGVRKRPMARVTAALRRQVDERAATADTAGGPGATTTPWLRDTAPATSLNARPTRVPILPEYRLVKS